MSQSRVGAQRTRRDAEMTVRSDIVLTSGRHSAEEGSFLGTETWRTVAILLIEVEIGKGVSRNFTKARGIPYTCTIWMGGAHNCIDWRLERKFIRRA